MKCFSTDLREPTPALHHFRLTHDGSPLTYAETLRLWQSDADFRSFFIDLLKKIPFEAFRWETPPVSASLAGRPFEFVVIESPELVVPPDRKAFAEHYVREEENAGVVAFSNLRGDAVLVVPSPLGPDSAYPHLAAFTRTAPEAQQHALWRTVGETVAARLTDRPLWLSTAGAGVAWLHVRLDDRPKYYRHEAFRNGEET